MIALRMSVVDVVDDDFDDCDGVERCGMHVS
jgi:hypothetical protein